MKEIWKDIPGYEGLYQVSNLGKVKSLYNYRGIGNLLKPKLKNNYYQVGLRKNNIRKWVSIHRLVAKTFISNPNNLPQVNHKDENKLNNNADNLEWCSALYNNIYGNRISKVKEKLEKPIIQYDTEGNVIKKWNSLKEASETLNISKGNISCCLNGKYKQTHNFMFKFDSEVM